MLIVCALGAAAVTAAAALLHPGIPLGIRAALGIPVVFLAPGYALKRAIFPAGPRGWPESTALLLGLSLVTTILVTLILNLLPWGLSAASWAIGIGSVTVAAVAVSACRAPRAYAWPSLSRPDRRKLPHRPGGRDLALLVLAGLVAAGAMVLAFRPLGPPPSAHGYTQLWLVRHGGTAQVGVACFQEERTHYLVEVLHGGKLEDRYPIALSPDRRWVTSLPDRPGVLQARLWLQLPGSKPILYRAVRLAPGART
jgi:uncharacterized membrane protein